MSNWYGMDQFPAVFDFHESRFQESDVIPTLFAGDFNAVPHTDGGDSPASVRLLEAGFTDAFRSLYPDPQEYLDTVPSEWEQNRSALLQGCRVEEHLHEGTLHVADRIPVGPLSDPVDLRSGLCHPWGRPVDQPQLVRPAPRWWPGTRARPPTPRPPFRESGAGPRAVPPPGWPCTNPPCPSRSRRWA